MKPVNRRRNPLSVETLEQRIALSVTPFETTVIVDGRDAVPFAGQDSAFLSSLVDGSPELKGNSVASYFGDLSDPEVIPTAVSLDDFSSRISISAGGFWSHTAVPDSGPEGKGIFEETSSQYTVFGISALGTDLNTLAGVFLSDDGPDPDNIPAALSTGDDMTMPELGQSFAIGAALDNIMVPDGATVLYLGLHDGFEWTNNSGTVEATIKDFVLPIDIDVKPGSDPNSINLKSNGVIPVAILTTSDFDATSVDTSTIEFGDARDGFACVQPVRTSIEDVDDDGDLDLILHFSTREIRESGALDADSVDALLAAETLDGVLVSGMDSVRMVPNKKK